MGKRKRKKEYTQVDPQIMFYFCLLKCFEREGMTEDEDMRFVNFLQKMEWILHSFSSLSNLEVTHKHPIWQQ